MTAPRKPAPSIIMPPAPHTPAPTLVAPPAAASPAPGRIPLFCVPFAGGSARAYRPWQREFAADWEVVPLELPGRGRRSGERHPGSVRAAARDLAATVRRRAGAEPYVLFGHSMGSLIVHEMAAARREFGLPPPALVVVSGRNPPHLRAGWSPRMLLLTDAELFAELAAVGGVPAGLSQSIAARFFLPLLRADLRMALDYEHVPGERPLDVPLLALSGRDDPLVDPTLIGQWGRCTTRGCTAVRYEGDHFSLFGRGRELSALMRAALPAPNRVPDREGSR